MRLGFSLPQFGSLAHHGKQLPEFARRAEELGAASLWVGDRLLAPVHPEVGYAGGPGIPREFNSRLDPFVALGAAAVATERAALGANVLILPLYRPASLARSLTTLDVLSGGRLVPGFGIGWSPEEYAAMGVPFRARGRRLDEGLDAVLALLRGGRAEYQGEHWTVPETHADLLTPQRPHPPVYLAGFTGSSLRRVGARADGWLPACLAGRTGQGAAVARARAAVDAAAREAGRDPAEIDAVLRVNAPPRTTVDAIAATVSEVTAATGIEHAFVDPTYVAGDVDHALRIAAELLDRLG